MARSYHPNDEPIPGYRLVESLGQGGFGQVWKARGPGHVEVAVKIVNLRRAGGEKELQATRRITQIRHPNLMPIIGFYLKDVDGNLLDDSLVEQIEDSRAANPADTARPPGFDRKQLAELIVVMTLGHKSLKDILDECQEAGRVGLPLRELLKYLGHAADGIDYLNGRGIQHCDIKPHNLMLVGDAIQVCDFGLARLQDIGATSSGAASYPYASPEFLVSGPGAASDQYSLAITYYELRTGQLPYGHLPEHAEAARHAMLLRKSTGELDLSGLSPSEQEIIAQATSIEPDNRWPSCRSMIDALCGVCQDVPWEVAGEVPLRAGRGRRDSDGLRASPGRSGSAVSDSRGDSARYTPHTGPHAETAMGRRSSADVPRRRTGRWLAAIVVLLGLVAGAWRFGLPWYVDKVDLAPVRTMVQEQVDQSDEFGKALELIRKFDAATAWAPRKDGLRRMEEDLLRRWSERVEQCEESAKFAQAFSLLQQFPPDYAQQSAEAMARLQRHMLRRWEPLWEETWHAGKVAEAAQLLGGNSPLPEEFRGQVRQRLLESALGEMATKDRFDAAFDALSQPFLNAPLDAGWVAKRRGALLEQSSQRLAKLEEAGEFAQALALSARLPAECRQDAQWKELGRRSVGRIEELAKLQRFAEAFALLDRLPPDLAEQRSSRAASLNKQLLGYLDELVAQNKSVEATGLIQDCERQLSPTDRNRLVAQLLGQAVADAVAADRFGEALAILKKRGDASPEQLGVARKAIFPQWARRVGKATADADWATGSRLIEQVKDGFPENAEEQEKVRAALRDAWATAMGAAASGGDIAVTDQAWQAAPLCITAEEKETARRTVCTAWSARVERDSVPEKFAAALELCRKPPLCIRTEERETARTGLRDRWLAHVAKVAEGGEFTLGFAAIADASAAALPADGDEVEKARAALVAQWSKQIHQLATQHEYGRAFALAALKSDAIRLNERKQQSQDLLDSVSGHLAEISQGKKWPEVQLLRQQIPPSQLSDEQWGKLVAPVGKAWLGGLLAMVPQPPTEAALAEARRALDRAPAWVSPETRAAARKALWGAEGEMTTAQWQAKFQAHINSQQFGQAQEMLALPPQSMAAGEIEPYRQQLRSGWLKHLSQPRTPAAEYQKECSEFFAAFPMDPEAKLVAARSRVRSAEYPLALEALGEEHGRVWDALRLIAQFRSAEPPATEAAAKQRRAEVEKELASIERQPEAGAGILALDEFEQGHLQSIREWLTDPGEGLEALLGKAKACLGKPAWTAADLAAATKVVQRAAAKAVSDKDKARVKAWDLILALAGQPAPDRLGSSLNDLTKLVEKGWPTTGEETMVFCRVLGGLGGSLSKEQLGLAMRLIRATRNSGLKVGQELAGLWERQLTAMVRAEQPVAGWKQELEELDADWKVVGAQISPKLTVDPLYFEAARREYLLLFAPDDPRVGTAAFDLEKGKGPYVAFVRARARHAADATGMADSILTDLQQVLQPPDHAPEVTKVPKRLEEALKCAVDCAKGLRKQAPGQAVSPAALLGNAYGAAEADRIYTVLQAIHKLQPQSPPLQLNLALAGLSRTPADWPLSQKLTAGLCDASPADRVDEGLALGAFLRARLEPPQAPQPSLEDGLAILKACDRLLNYSRQYAATLPRHALRGEDTGALYTKILVPVQPWAEAWAKGANEARACEQLESFFANTGKFLWEQRHAAWPVGKDLLAVRAQQSLQQAIGVSQKAGQSDPIAARQAEHHLLCGKILAERAKPDLDNAILETQAALAVASTQREAHALLCSLYFRLAKEKSDRDGHLKALSQAIEQGNAVLAAGNEKAGQAALLLDLSSAYLFRANIEPANLEEDLKKALQYAGEAKQLKDHLKKEDQVDFPYLAMGNAYEDLAWLAQKEPAKNYPEAIREFTEAADHVPFPAVAWASVGRCYYRAIVETGVSPKDAFGKPDETAVLAEGIKALEKALQFERDCAEANSYLGLILKYQRHYEQADTYLEKAKDYAKNLPDYAMHVREWARLPLEEEGKSDKAVERATVLQKTPPPPGGWMDPVAEAAVIQAKAHCLAKQFEAAENACTQALPNEGRFDFRHVELLIQRAVCRVHQAGDSKDPPAIQRLRLAVQDCIDASKAAKWPQDKAQAYISAANSCSKLYKATGGDDDCVRGIGFVKELEKIVPAGDPVFSTGARLMFLHITGRPTDVTKWNEDLSDWRTAIGWQGRMMTPNLETQDEKTLSMMYRLLDAGAYHLEKVLIANKEKQATGQGLLTAEQRAEVLGQTTHWRQQLIGISNSRAQEDRTRLKFKSPEELSRELEEVKKLYSVQQ